MKFSLFLTILAMTSNLYAKPSCLSQGTCFEYEGNIIDMRSEAGRQLDRLKGCDPLVEKCHQHFMQDEVRLSSKEARRIFQDERAEYFIPLALESSDAMLLAGALSLGTIVFANDREIMDFVQDHKTEQTAEITHIGNMLGREAIAPIAAGAYFVGAILDNGKLKKVGLFTVSAGLATQLVTEMFKKSFGRLRPNASDNPYDFGNQSGMSFFSGHTSGAFSLATVIAEIYKDKPVVPYLAYGAAALTAYARMHDNKHWASDVLAGAIAGHLITKILIRTIENSSAAQSGIVISPYHLVDDFGRNEFGVEFSYRGKPNNEFQCKNSGLDGRELIQLCVEEIFEKSEF